MKNKTSGIFATIFFTLISILFVSPILIVLMNSFKKKAFISLEPFKLPNEKSYVGLENYLTSISKYDFIKAVGWTVFITVLSVIVILVCCSMCAWYITRVQNKITKLIYLLCVFSMVIPFQMVMFTLSGTADTLGLNTPWGLIIVYLGFGAGLAVFMFCGFVKSIPVEIEEAADPPHTEPIPGFSHTEHQYKSLDIQIYPLNTETSSYFHHTQGSYKSCSSVLAESPSAPPPETPCGTNTLSPEILLPPFSEETSAHTSFPP